MRLERVELLMPHAYCLTPPERQRSVDSACQADMIELRWVQMAVAVPRRGGAMQIDWNRTINDILGDKVACLRCGSLTAEIVVGYSRSPAANDWSPRVHDCAHKDECDARRLVVVCEGCARELRLRA